MNLKDINTMNTIDRMINGYMIQDKKAKRSIDKTNYVDEEYILDLYKQQSGLCNGCGCYMSFEKHSNKKVTVDRANNNIGHSKSNCPKLLCNHCNCATSHI